MTQGEQTEAFYDDILAVVERYRKEFDLSYACTIGCLHLIMAELAEEALDASTEK